MKLRFEIKDLYVFGEYTYFSFLEYEDMVYYKTTNYGLLLTGSKGETGYNEQLTTYFEATSKLDLIQMDRGDYYDEIKKNLYEYCNFEVAQRLGGIKDE